MSERPKRISKPNLRYQSVEIFKKPIETKYMQKAEKQLKSSKQFTKGVQCLKRATKCRKESGQLRLLTDVASEQNSSKLKGRNRSSIAATKIKSLIEAANEVKLTTESQNTQETLTSDILTTEALKDNEPKKIHLTCKQHNRKLKKSKKFIIDCSDVNFIDVNDVLKYIRSNIKIDGKKNNFGSELKFEVDDKKVVLFCQINIKIQYLKSLSKEFLRKNKMYCVRVENKNPVLKYVHKD